VKFFLEIDKEKSTILFHLAATLVTGKFWLKIVVQKIIPCNSRHGINILRDKQKEKQKEK